MNLKSIDISVTSNCNLRCKHCYQAAGKKENNFNLPLSVLWNICSDSILTNVDTIIFSGGEFFCYPDYQQVFLIISKYSNEINFKLSTNGTLIDSLILNWIKKSGLKSINISIDGFKENHDARRGDGSFAKSINSIKNLILINVSVSVTITIDNVNIQYIEYLIAYLKYIGVKEINMINIACTGNAICHNELILNKKYYSYLKILYRKFGTIVKSTNRCNMFYRTLSIDHDGVIYPCTMARSMKILELGNVIERSFIDVWSNANRTVGPVYSNCTRDNLSKCTMCENYLKCGGGCRVRAYKKYKNFHSPDEFACFIFSKEKYENPNKLMWGE